MRVVRATRRLRRLGASTACAGSSSGATGANGAVGPAAGAGGASPLADRKRSTSLPTAAAEGRLLSADSDADVAIGHPRHSPMSRLLHAAKGGTTDPLLVLVLAFFLMWGFLAGLKALVSRRRRTIGPL